MYDINLTVTLCPQWHRDQPHAVITCGGRTIDLVLERETQCTFDWSADRPQRLMIEFDNKSDADTVPDLGLDKSIEIKEIGFFGITDPRFVWLGCYQPEYPEPWASQQRQQGQDLPAVLTNVDRLSWNGRWWLDFDLPIFTWIHQVQNLGWIYR